MLTAVSKTTRRPLRFTLLWAALIPIVLSGCGLKQQRTVPITTNSQEALDHYLAGRDFADRLREVDARAEYQKAVEIDPEFALAWLGLSGTSEDTPEFMAHVNRAISLKDKVSEGERIWLEAVEAGNLHGDLARQEQLFKKLVELFPKDERVHQMLGNLYFGTQRWEEAIKEYKTAIKLAPYFSQSYNQLGYVYRALEKYELAEKSFEEYIEVIPDEANPYDSYAELLLKRGKYRKAIESYRKALANDSGFVASNLGIATCYNFLGEYAAARAELWGMYDRSESDARRRAALFGLVVSYCDEGKYDSALAISRERYDLAASSGNVPGMGGDLSNDAFILAEIGRSEEARSLFDRAQALIENSSLPNNVKELSRQGYRFGLARVALAEKNVDAAREQTALYMAQARSTSNLNQIRQAHFLAGSILLLEKKYEDAIGELEKANQQFPYTFYQLAACYEALGDRVNARRMYDKVANFNALNSLLHSLIRKKAQEKLKQY